MARALLTHESRRQRMVSGSSCAATSSIRTCSPRSAWSEREPVRAPASSARRPMMTRCHRSGQTIRSRTSSRSPCRRSSCRPRARARGSGPGSGYAPRLLGSLAARSRRRAHRGARRRAARARPPRVHNVHVHHGDGSRGWPPGATYEAMRGGRRRAAPRARCSNSSSTAAAWCCRHGDVDHQRLVRITHRGPGQFDEEDLGEVRFVPLLASRLAGAAVSTRR